MGTDAAQRLRIAVVGLGPIGLEVARHVVGDPMLSLSGLVDIDPKKQGKRLEDFIEGVRDSDVTIMDDVEALSDTDVVILCTASYFDRIAPTLRMLMRKKANVVSSCEEMAWPWLNNPHLADVINNEAIAAGVTLVGTGVNPGFVMDVLPVALSSMTLNVTKVRVVRVVDALTRRLPLQRKIGSGMTVEHFNKLAKQNQIGHMGIGESVTMLAQGLGRHPMRSEVKISLRPVIAERSIESAMGTVEPGEVCGMHNVGKWSDETLEIELDLTMALAAREPRDEITISGDRTITTIIPGSTPGDTATVASLVNVARIVHRAGPGLKTMLDLPVVGSR